MLVRFEDALKKMLVYKNLRTLCEVRRALAAVLNRAQIVWFHPAFPQLLPQNICCRDSVLNREIDTDTAHR